MNPQKRRGDAFERDVVKVLRANGHIYAERGLRLGAVDDRADIAGLPGFHMECRDRGKLELGYWMTATAIEAGLIPSAPVPVLVIKRRGKSADQAFAVTELAAFARLIADGVEVSHDRT